MPPMPIRWWYFFCLLPLLSCGKKDPVLAQVGTHTVTASDFKKEVEGVPFTSQSYLRSPTGRKELLELLVRRKIILAEADAKAPDAETKTLLAELDKQYKEQQKQLKDHFGEEQERLRVTQFMKSLKEGPLKVTEEDVQRFWEKENEVRAAHILVSHRSLADTLRKKISDGEKFETLAKAFSEDTASAAKGGDAGYLLPGSLVPEFESALFSMKKGEISDVVVSPYGFHIIRRGDDRALSDHALDDALKTRLRRTMESQKLQAWFESTRSRHRITINNENLQDVMIPSPAADPEAPSKGSPAEGQTPSK